MEDMIDQYIKNKVLRVIDFCEGEGIELFTFTDVDTGGDFSVLFDLDSNFGEYWQLIVTMQYFNFMVDDEEIKEDKSYYYKIEGETFTQVENFDEDYEDEDYYDDEDEE